MPDLSKTEQCNLSIRISPNGFSFYLVDPAKGEEALYESFMLSQRQSLVSAIEEMMFKNEYLLLPYKRTDLVFVSPYYSIVPAGFVTEGKVSKLLNFVQPESQGKYCLNHLRNKELINQFMIDEAVLGYLSRTLTISRITHYITPLLEYFNERSRFGNFNKMYVNMEQDRLDLFCFQGNQLVLANSYNFQQLNDAVYFVLYAWEKLEMHQVNDEVHICGDPGLRSRMIPQLSKYIQRVLPLNPPTSWFIAPADNKALPLDLKTLSLCV